MRSLFIAFVCALVAPSLGAQMVWTQVSNTGPSPTSDHAMAYDDLRGRAVLFDGSDTWEWDGQSWARMSPATSPAARSGHAMSFDRARGKVVLFGGFDFMGTLGDTWEWDGTDWTSASPTLGPARGHGAMAYDELRQRIVLFGGSYYGPRGVNNYGDTWEWDGRTWHLVDPDPGTGPTPRIDHAMAYDAVRQCVVVHAGYFDDGWDSQVYSDTWEWDGATWTQRGSGGAVARFRHQLAWDAARQRIVVFGGVNLGGVLGDTREWDGQRWTQVPVAGPGPRRRHAMVWESTRRRVLLFGGEDGSALGDTWTYRPTVRGAAAQVGFGCAGSAGTPTLGALGPPIVGNADFALEVGTVPASANVFLGLSTELAATPLPPCWVYPRVPFLDVLAGTATGGAVEIPLAIPWISALSGADLFVQGGALDPQGALLGLASLTPGMQIRIGD